MDNIIKIKNETKNIVCYNGEEFVNLEDVYIDYNFVDFFVKNSSGNAKSVTTDMEIPLYKLSPFFHNSDGINTYGFRTNPYFAKTLKNKIISDFNEFYLTNRPKIYDKIFVKKSYLEGLANSNNYLIEKVDSLVDELENLSR